VAATGRHTGHAAMHCFARTRASPTCSVARTSSHSLLRSSTVASTELRLGESADLEHY
jgi:hypothetical protein